MESGEKVKTFLKDKLERLEIKVQKESIEGMVVVKTIEMRKMEVEK